MCRYGTNTYKPHLACFNCRKTFKRKLLIDIDRNHAYDETKEESPAKCPECGGHVADMGLDFKSPKKSDIKAWKHVKNLYSVGITFHSCGCTGPGYIPNTSVEIEKYLNRIRNRYVEQYRFWAHKKENPTLQSEISKDQHKNGRYYGTVAQSNNMGSKNKPKYDIEAIQNYWNKKIAEIDQRLKINLNTTTTI